MTPAWASAIAAIVMMTGTAGLLVWRDGRRQGAIEAILERLVKIAEDHEARIRAQERRRRNR